MSVAEDLQTVADDLTTLQGVVAQAVTDLNVPETDSVGDQFLANAISFLTGLNYVVTAPAPETETPAEEPTEPVEG